MDVFVIPVGQERYELYCEHALDTEHTAEPPATGLVGKVRDRFMARVRAAEEQHRRGIPADHADKSFIGRMQDYAMAWVAERIAEQRLLWNLRGQTAAVIAHPQDMSFDEVLTLVRRTLQHDHERHKRWMIIDGVAFLVTFIVLGPLFLLIPGIANLPALYFGFRTIGHWLSMRGAANGLHGVQWTGRPCPPLGELRELAVLEPPDRSQRLHDIAARLRLQHLSTFFDRVAIHHA
jgi:hypothetical protein